MSFVVIVVQSCSFNAIAADAAVGAAAADDNYGDDDDGGNDDDGHGDGHGDGDLLLFHQVKSQCTVQPMRLPLVARSGANPGCMIY